jgi:hypothetical protein
MAVSQAGPVLISRCEHLSIMKFRRHVLLLAALFMISLDVAGVSAQTPGPFQDLTLVLETPKTKYLELQPIPLVVTLKNATPKPLVGHTVLQFGASFSHLYIDRPEGPQEVPVSTMILDVVASPRVFPPGEQIKETVSLNLMSIEPAQVDRIEIDDGIRAVINVSHRALQSPPALIHRAILKAKF